MEESYDILIQMRLFDKKRSTKMEDKGWSELDLLAILAIHSHLVDNAYFILYYEKLEQHSKNWINMKI